LGLLGSKMQLSRFEMCMFITIAQLWKLILDLMIGDVVISDEDFLGFF